MKHFLIFFFGCIVAVSIAINTTVSTNNTVKVVVDDDNNNESFYTVDVLLTAGEVFSSKMSQNDTGLSIRLTARDGTISAWYRLYSNGELNYFGQRSYVLPGATRNLGLISSISIRVDQIELAVLSMPYYLCIHGTTNNNTINENWSGCAYIQPPVESKNSDDKQYPLLNANGKLI
ncbi:unnamed protein product [Adineta steineri]|uniref:Uncharacterized protein n=1 Tax=Adineta steineri TaxID=433720 RepID=A0A815TR58_9BILA|nr:unnamed protein product [Adineta steineri]CAF1509073.1 unnamed protein product [Adineta steineri]CAF1509497.1 unnamed protein product [Adineta steineri]